jgi:copper transport protein
MNVEGSGHANGSLPGVDLAETRSGSAREREDLSCRRGRPPDQPLHATGLEMAAVPVLRGRRAPGAVRWVAGVLLVVLAWSAAAIAGAPAAEAHADLVSSRPRPGAHLDAAPNQIMLSFTEPVSLIDRGFRLLGAGAVDQQVGAPSGDGTTVVSVPVEGTLPDGEYVFIYRVVSADSHPIAGTVPFAVGEGGEGSGGLGDVTIGTSPSLRALWALDRWLGLGGLMLLLGVPAFVAVCWQVGARDPVLRRLVGVGAGLVVATALASLPLQAAYATGRPVWAALGDGSIPDLLTRPAGKAALLRAGAAVFLFALLAMAAHRRPTRRLAFIACGTAGALLLSHSWAGHAVVARYPAATIANDSVHLAAAAVWLGGLACLALRVLTGPGPDRPRVLRRWSGLAMAAVAVLVVSGSVQAWRGVGSVRATLDTTYGRLVLAKVAGLVVLLVLGNMARRWVRHRADDQASAVGALPAGGVGASVGAMLAGPPDGGIRAVRRSVLAEVVIGAAVLAATAMLVVTPPGRTVAAPPASSPATATQPSASPSPPASTSPSAPAGQVPPSVVIDLKSDRAGPTPGSSD